MRWIIVLLAGCSGDAANPEPGDTGSSDTDTDAADDVAPPDDISDVMASVVDRHGVPSIVGAVMKGDRLAALGVAGVRKDGDSTASEAADLYHLGSCTKAMTSTLLGTLVQDGTMYWDTTMSVAFPDIDLHPDYENVTLTMMLQHMGGAWGNINDYPEVASVLWEDGDPVEQRAWLTEQVLSQTRWQLTDTDTQPRATGECCAGACPAPSGSAGGLYSRVPPSRAQSTRWCWRTSRRTTGSGTTARRRRR